MALSSSSLTPNASDNQSKAHIETAVISVLLPLTWVTVCLRLWVRLRMTKSLGWDDAVMFLTLILYTCCCSFMLVLISLGAFAHLYNIGNETVLYVLLAESFYVLATTALKLALGLFFLRIIVVKWQKYTFYAMLIVSTVYGVAYFFLAIFQCGLPSRFLEAKMSGGHGCAPDSVYLPASYIYATISIFSEWIFVILPLFMLRTVVLDRRTKVSVGLIMALGAIGSVSTVIRIAYIDGLVVGPDWFYKATSLSIWSTIEPGTGIAAGSLATLRPLLRRTVQQTRRTLSHIPMSMRRGSFKRRSHTSRTGFHTFDDDDQSRKASPTMNCRSVGTSPIPEDAELGMSRKDTNDTLRGQTNEASLRALEGKDWRIEYEIEPKSYFDD